MRRTEELEKRIQAIARMRELSDRAWSNSEVVASYIEQAEEKIRGLQAEMKEVRGELIRMRKRLRRLQAIPQEPAL